jgi:hypothetical protein
MRAHHTPTYSIQTIYQRLVGCLQRNVFLRSINDFFDEYFEQNIFCPPLSLPPNTFMIFAVCFVGSFSFNRQNCVEEVGRASLKN